MCFYKWLFFSNWFRSVLTHGYLFYTLNYSIILLSFLAQFIPVRPLGTLSVGACIPLTEFTFCVKLFCVVSELLAHTAPWEAISSARVQCSFTVSFHFSFQFSLVQSLSCVWLFVTPWTAARQSSLSITNSWACLNSCKSSQWCHPTVLSSDVPFSSCLQSFPASGSFLVSQFFASGGQRIGVSASASVLPVNIQDWFSLCWTGWISLQSKGLSRVFSNTTVQKHQFFCAQLSLVLWLTNFQSHLGQPCFPLPEYNFEKHNFHKDDDYAKEV